MTKRNILYGICAIPLTTLLFFACSKKKVTGQPDDTAKTIGIYEEIGKRHNDFLARSFPQVKTRLTRQKATRTSMTIAPEEMYNAMLSVSSENLVPVLGYQYMPQQLLPGLEQNLPQELLFGNYQSTEDCLQAHMPGTVLSPIFTQALHELDQLLERCIHYSDSASIFSTFTQLRNKYTSLLTDPAEKEPFIAGTILGKHSLSWWAQNEQHVMNMFSDMPAVRTPGKLNPVREDVRGMVIGGIRGALAGGLWGSGIPGIGSVFGVITGGLFGAGAHGCISSLGAGLRNALFN
jgi:hypothetical protein